MPSEERPWHDLTERGSTWGLRLTIAVFRLFGKQATAVLVHLVAAYFWMTDPRGRRASRSYLRRVAAHPDGRAALGCQPGWRATYRHFQSFGTSLLDRLAMLAGCGDQLNVTVHGGEHLDHLLTRGRGGILLGSHLGSLDMLRLCAEARGVPVNAVMYTRHAKRFQAAVRKVNPEADLRVIHLEEGSIQATFDARACVERGELVAILGDRIAAGQRQRTSSVMLLGDKVRFPHAPLLLASLVGCPVLLAFGYRDDRGAYHVRIEPFADRIELHTVDRDETLSQHLQDYATRIEGYCVRVPYQWFNFHDIWCQQASEVHWKPERRSTRRPGAGEGPVT